MRASQCRSAFAIVFAASLIVFAASASGQEYESKSAAAAAGDPAASAPAIDLPETFLFEGKRIAAEAAMEQGLVCDQDADGVVCRTPEAQRTSKAKARAASTCSDLTVLSLFQYAQSTACLYTGNGWRLNLVGRHSWYNMGSYSNEASAYYMGNHSGHMSEFNDGNGYWVPYATGVADYYLNLNGTGWSDRIDSRYRN